MIIKTAIWFSRHSPTPEQLNEIAQRGYRLVNVEDGLALGAISLNTRAEGEVMISRLYSLARPEGASAVFGVFPTALLAVAWRGASEYLATVGDFWHRRVILFGSINIQRTSEGGRPTFDHGSWEEVGSI